MKMMSISAINRIVKKLEKACPEFFSRNSFIKLGAVHMDIVNNILWRGYYFTK